jgi:hypothetical protein
VPEEDLEVVVEQVVIGLEQLLFQDHLQRLFK